MTPESFYFFGAQNVPSCTQDWGTRHAKKSSKKHSQSSLTPACFTMLLCIDISSITRNDEMTKCIHPYK